MELRVLKYFLMIAREENITRAAQLLHVTQPTLSRQIRELEEELGTKLFERSNHRIVLTQGGLLLRRRAQEIVELTERTEKDFAHKDEELTGEIAIGSGETRSVSALAEVLSSFRQRYPRVRYRFYSGNASRSALKTARWISDCFPNRWIYPDTSLSACRYGKNGAC